jgi:NAD(P)-dependent dehydrogenase (short-subunit alcohol dehydrogenase family)
MEKLVYVVWKPEAVAAELFRDRLLGEVASRLVAAGAHRLAVSVADEHVAFAQHARIAVIDPPISGLVCLWLDTHLKRRACDEILAAATERFASYLVVESRPIVNTTHTAPLGQRTPGVNTVAFIEVPPRLEYEQWREIWQESHTQLAIDTQSTFLYTQNLVVRALSEAAPAWAAIVEEGFPADSFRDPKVFYDAGDSEEKLHENRKKMVESCQRFIDFERLESHPVSEYILRD